MPDYTRTGSDGTTRGYHITSSQQRLMSKMKWEQTVRHNRWIRDQREHALPELVDFIGEQQRAVLSDALQGEEREWFAQKVAEIRGIVAAMPVTYETIGNPRTVAQLHYFTSNFDAYVVEKDQGDPNDAPGAGQVQAFGVRGYNGQLSFGYINIKELLDNGAELDLHWTPQLTSEVLHSHGIALS